MNKCVVAGLMGLAVGMYIGYSQEEGIEDLCRESRRKKKKVMKIYSMKKLSLYLFYTILGICEENVMMI